MSIDIGATADFAKSEVTKVTADGRTLVVVRIEDDFYLSLIHI